MKKKKRILAETKKIRYGSKMENKKIAVWFSCGAASAVAAKKTIEKYGKENEIIVLNNPVAEEHPDNMRFLKDVEKWLGSKIELVVNPKYPNASCYEVWEKQKWMGGINGAPCTLQLKKRARQHWEKNNPVDFHVLGFTYDEIKRHERFVLSERENVLPVLIDEKISKNDCFKIINKAGINLPEIYKLGYPNANCIGCVKATSPTYWNHVRKTFPDIFESRAEQSRRIGAKLVRVKGERIYLDELNPNAKGRPMKKMAIDCGIFCEEL